MFDYEKFKSDIAVAMEKSLRKWAEENDDIYIISLDLSRDMTSVGVWANTMNDLDVQDYDASEDYWYFKYCEQEWELCEALEVFKESVNKDFPELLITFNINEYLDDDERIEVFSLVNSKKAAEEYMKHVADFN